MPGRFLPNLGLKGFFTSGEAGWGSDVDTNFLKLSVLTQGNVVNKVSETPGSPTEGQVYIFDHTHPTQPNKVAVFDNANWVYLTPAQGWSLFNIATGRYEDFTTVWTSFTTPIVQKVSLSGISTYTFSSIPQNFSGLRVVINAATTQAVVASTTNLITINGLSTAIYSMQRQYSISTTVASNQVLLGTSLGPLAGLAGSTTIANTASFIDIDFFEYSNTSFRKYGKFLGREPTSASTTAAYVIVGQFEIGTTDAITSITITNGGAVDFANGSTVSLTLIP